MSEPSSAAVGVTRACTVHPRVSGTPAAIDSAASWRYVSSRRTVGGPRRQEGGGGGGGGGGSGGGGDGGGVGGVGGDGLVRRGEPSATGTNRTTDARRPRRVRRNVPLQRTRPPPSVEHHLSRATDARPRGRRAVTDNYFPTWVWGGLRYKFALFEFYYDRLCSMKFGLNPRIPLRLGLMARHGLVACGHQGPAKPSERPFRPSRQCSSLAYPVVHEKCCSAQWSRVTDRRRTDRKIKIK